MNRFFTTITLLCFSVGAIAQEKEIWACQSESDGAAGIVWRDGSANIASFNQQTLLLTIDGENSSYTLNGTDYSAVCRVEGWVSCIDETNTQHILLSTTFGQAGLSNLFATVLPPSTRDNNNIYVVSFNCTKF